MPERSRSTRTETAGRFRPCPRRHFPRSERSRRTAHSGSRACRAPTAPPSELTEARSPCTTTGPHGRSNRRPRSASTRTKAPWTASCTSSTDCIAVGSYHQAQQGNYSVTLPLIERWNGASWSIQTAGEPPDAALPPGYTYFVFSAVSCTASTACTAVGEYATRAGKSGALVERFDGKRWTFVPVTPGPSTSYNGLTGVSCTTAVTCHTAPVDAQPVPPPTPSAATLAGMPAACVAAPFTARVTGKGLASVRWWLDGRPTHGRTIRRGTRYTAAFALSPGAHQLVARVTFAPSARARPRTLRRTIRGCPREGEDFRRA